MQLSFDLRYNKRTNNLFTFDSSSIILAKEDIKHMYIDDLVEVFDRAVSDFPELSSAEISKSLREGLVAKKYDLQDEGLIEAILREDKHELVEPLKQGLNSIEKTEDIKKEAIKIFIASLEHLIDYYYNNVIGKHFSST